LLAQAVAARDRGNLEAAFWLLDEEVREHPTGVEAAIAFWDVAVSLDRCLAAASAAVTLIEHHAAAESVDLAAQYFAELSTAVPDALVSPTAVARMLPALRERLSKAEAEDEQEAARGVFRHALQQALDPQNEGLTPGLALHLFRESRDVEPDGAGRAAEVALASPDLHEAKRGQLREWLEANGNGLPEIDTGPPDDGDLADVEPGSGERAEVGSGERAEVARPSADPALPPPESATRFSSDSDAFAFGEGAAEPENTAVDLSDEPILDPLSDEEVAKAAKRLLPRVDAEATPQERASPANLEVLQATPVSLADEALELLLPGGRSSRVGWREIQALSVAEVRGLAPEPVVVIDCILNWLRRHEEPLRLVRLRADRFDPVEIAADEGSLAGFLGALLERSRAIPLPDPESALGLRPACFESLAAYEAGALGARQP